MFKRSLLTPTTIDICGSTSHQLLLTSKNWILGPRKWDLQMFVVSSVSMQSAVLDVARQYKPCASYNMPYM